MQNHYFYEKQKFTQTWVWIILLVSFTLPVIIPFLSSEDVKFFNDNSKSVLALGFFFLFFFYLLELRVSVNEEGIHYQFFPIHFKKYTIKFDEIEEFKAVSYSPLKDYRGWGIKHGFSGTAYNVKGSKGVRIHLKNKSRHILFGSQENEAFEEALKKFIKP